jgi:NAD(P)-dependent dehydrogenase (short-subunit alcohol dehydrogenase family)
MNWMGALEGKVALITGASQGTGQAIATRFAAEGARVAITARSEAGLAETIGEIEAIRGQGLALPCDLADPDGGRTTLIARTEAAFGPLDILVNNAVVTDHLKRVHEFSLADLERLNQVNLWTPWMLMAEAIPGMTQRGRGHILNLTSFGGELFPGPPFANVGRDGGAGYGTTKAALNRLTVAAAGELQSAGVAVNALTPQRSIRTRERVPTAGKGLDILEPMDTMAEAALALCSGDPAVLTGRIAYSLQLLYELQRPVWDLAGKELVEGWQPADLPPQIHVREDNTEQTLGWKNAFDFQRPHTPYPAALRRG